MDQGSLSKLISSCQEQPFLKIAEKFCSIFLRVTAINVNGKGDGGSDFRVYQKNDFNDKIAIQISIQKKWENKAKDDARKANEQLNIQEYYYLSSRIISNTNRIKIEQEIKEKISLDAKIFGASEIAGILLDNNEEYTVFEALGISLDLGKRSITLRDRVLFSYIALSDEVRDFKKAVIEQHILSLIMESDSSMNIDEIINRTADNLGVGDSDKIKIKSRVDNLLQEGKILRNSEGTFELTDKEKENRNKLMVLYEAEKELYIDGINHIIEKELNSKIAKNDVWEIGKIIADSQINTQLNLAQSIEKNSCIGLLLKSNRDYQREIYSKFNELNFPQSKQKSLYQKLVEFSSTSTLAKKLASATVYFSLNNTSNFAIIQTLKGASMEALVVWIDASVAIPWICTKLYGDTIGRYDKNTIFALKSLKDSQAIIKIPGWYIEECATHFLGALNYIGNDDVDIFTLHSPNGFVSHYASLPDINRPNSFKIYLEEIIGLSIDSFGIDWTINRKRCIDKIKPLFSEYNIGYEYIPLPNDNSRRDIETEIAYLSRQHRTPKSKVLLDHDVSVMCYIREQVARGDIGCLFLTWDSVLIRTGYKFDLYGWIMNPTVVADLFVSTHQSDDLSLSSLAIILAKSDTIILEKIAIIIDNLLKKAGEKAKDADFKKDLSDLRRNFLITNDIGDPDYHRKFEEAISLLENKYKIVSRIDDEKDYESYDSNDYFHTLSREIRNEQLQLGFNLE